MEVGSRGTGTLNITGGGLVESTSGQIAEDTDGVGTVNVAGPNSRWLNSGDMSVGKGLAALNITGGARVENTEASILNSGALTSTVKVDGPNSQWISSGLLTVAILGKASLEITDSGSVSSAGGTIGLQSSANGTVTVSGANSVWTIDGPLFIGGSETGNGGRGTLRIQSGGTVQVAQHTILFADDELRLDGGTFSSSDISMQGGGTFVWTSGTLRAGIYRGSLVVPSGGILAPGNSAGSTEVRVDYSQMTGGILQIEIGGPAATQHDRVTVTGGAFLGGDLQLALLGGFLPSPASTFTIFDARGISGVFDNVANGQRLATSDGLGSFLVNYGPGSPFDPTEVILSQFHASLAGDFDLDGDVDGNDFLVWQRGGSPIPLSAGDLANWRTNFGAPFSASANSTAVPEPSTRALAIIIAVASRYRRRPTTPRVATTH